MIGYSITKDNRELTNLFVKSLNRKFLIDNYLLIFYMIWKKLQKNCIGNEGWYAMGDKVVDDRPQEIKVESQNNVSIKMSM